MLSKFPVSIFITEYVYHTNQGECSFSHTHTYTDRQTDRQTGRYRCIHYTSRQMHTDTHWCSWIREQDVTCRGGEGQSETHHEGGSLPSFIVNNSEECSCAQCLTHAKLLSLLRHFLKLQIRSSSIAPREPVTLPTEQICCSPSGTNYICHVLFEEFYTLVQHLSLAVYRRAANAAVQKALRTRIA